MAITLEAIRAAGGIVHSDGNIFFRDISMLQGLAGAAPAAVAPQGVTAWMHPETLEVISDAKKHEMSTQYGTETRRKAEGYSVAMAPVEQSAAAPALEAPAAPAGWKLVPTKATSDMLYAMAECDGHKRGDRDHPGLTQWEDYWHMALAAAPQAPAAPVTVPAAPAAPAVDAPIVWPKARDVGRIGDMSPSAHLRIGLDSDNDVYASIWDERGGATIEFCTPGQGGGKSSRTRMALLAVMVAMEADNAADPGRDWWAERNRAAQAAAKGEHDAAD